MTPIIPTLTISLLLLILYIVLTYGYKSYLDKLELKKQQQKIELHIDKYIPEEKKDEMREKLDKISNIIKETEKSLEREIEKKVKAGKSQISSKDNETLIIEQAEKEYRIHSEEFSSAMPRSEDELQEDIKNLKESIGLLESFDKEYYLSEPEKADMGIGMFYDKVTRKFQQIISETEMSEFKIIPLQRLKYHAFSQIKNIKDKDFLPILKVMKETKLINDFIEINPQLQVVVFSEEDFDFSNPEKVILTFVYEKDDLAIEDLLNLTEWDFSYASKILNELFSKQLASIEDDKIVIEGFGTSKERRMWDFGIQKFLEQESRKSKEKEQKLKKMKLKLEQKVSEADSGTEKKIRQNYIIEDEEDLKQENIPKIKFKTIPQVKKLAEIKKIREIYEDTPEKVSDEDLKKLISQTILSFHEKYSLLNGGLVQYKKLSDYIYNDIENATEDLIAQTLKKLVKLKMIYESFEIDEYKFYSFKELKLEDSEKEFITLAINKEPLNKEKFIEGLNWDEEKVLTTMQNLQKKGILRIEKNNIIIPGIIQTK
jgi:hypothetical protein